MQKRRLGYNGYRNPEQVTIRKNGLLWVNNHLMEKMNVFPDNRWYASLLVCENKKEVQVDVEFVSPETAKQHKSSTLRKVSRIHNGWLVNVNHLFRYYKMKPKFFKLNATTKEGVLRFDLDIRRKMNARI